MAMGLRRRISYQWQMFIPLITSLWVLIFGMAFWQIYNEREYRQSTLREQLSLINERIKSYYETESNPLDFLRFLSNYYQENPLYDRIRISVYEDDKLIYNVGSVINLPDTDAEDLSVINHIIDEDADLDLSDNNSRSLNHNNFFYKPTISENGRLKIFTVLPYDSDINAASLPNSNIWIIVFTVAIIMTIIAYFSTRYFGRNIKILRTIADKAATDPNFMPSMDYPHDELGDISRQIIHMYNERSKVVLKLKREHRIAMHAMEEKARIKRQLTNNINHELKTPIGVIKGYLDTIMANPDMDDASRDHFISKALEHANRLANLITDVSAITRLEEGSSMINTEELDYHDIVYTVMNDLEESEALGSMEFVYDVPTDCIIMGNNNLLTGMLINLAKNAVLYSKGTECGVKLIDEDNKFYKFVFFDNGIGVGEEHLPHLFERFYRIDSGRSRKTGGTGLGLPIVQNTVLAHGGTIEIRNNPQGGLEFVYTLPKAQKS